MMEEEMHCRAATGGHRIADHEHNENIAVGMEMRIITQQ
jgi:hypothetical protein